MFGSPETTTGGRALKFYSSMRIDIRRIGALKDGDQTIGNRTKLRVVKNKVAAPFRVAEFDILYGKGISREGDLLDLGVAHRIVDKSGSWYSYGDLRLGQGRENSRNFLLDNNDLAMEIDAKLRAELGLKGGAPEPAAEAASEEKAEKAPAKAAPAKAPAPARGRAAAKPAGAAPAAR